MTDPTITSELAAAWAAVLSNNASSGWRLGFFDERRGLLFVECLSPAWKRHLRLLEAPLRAKLNTELGKPVIRRVAPTIPEARILVTGSRSWDDEQALADALLEAWYDAVQDATPSVDFIVIHGDCPQGADAHAKQWAIDNNLTHIPVPADWSAPCTDQCPPGHRKTSARHGDYCPLAGHHRNQQMVDMRPDLVLAFRRNNSRGTSDCIRRAERAGIPIRILEDNHG